MRGSSRLDGLPEYLAAALARKVAEARAAGVDVISLGVGDPDGSPPPELRDALGAALRRDDTHGYPTNHGIAPLREAVASHYRSRFGVTLDPEREILPLLGAKEGLAHLCLAQLDPGQVALVGDPGYPVYAGGPVLAGAEAVGLPLRRERGFLPDLDAVDAVDAARANLLICGYPNNPTGAVADVAFMERLALWGLEHGVPICHDNAYAELTFDGIVAPSSLEAPHGREAGIEVYSLSKALCMPGWRVAFAVGNAEVVGRLRRLKTQIDAGMWVAMQHAAIVALEICPRVSAGLRVTYQRRRDLVCDRLAQLGIDVVPPGGALYVWMPVPGGEGSVAFAERVLADAAVVVGPGAAYGAGGEGYVRLALTAPDDRLAEAVERIAGCIA